MLGRSGSHITDPKIIYNAIHRKNHVVTMSKNARATNFDIVWENIHKVKLYDLVFNVNYMILHGVLPVKNNTCLWYGQTETLEHFFYFCDGIQLCLDWLQDILSSRFFNVRFLDDEFIYSSFQYNHTHFLKTVLITTYMLKGHVWARRQATLYFDVICTDIGILKGFQYKLKERIKLNFSDCQGNFLLISGSQCQI